MPRDTETGQPAKGLRTSAHRLPVALPASNRGAARLHRSSGHGHWLASIEGERPTEGLHRLPLAAPELRLHRTEGAAHGCTGCHRRAASIEGGWPTEGLHRLPLAAPELRPRPPWKPASKAERPTEGRRTSRTRRLAALLRGFCESHATGYRNRPTGQGAAHVGAPAASGFASIEPRGCAAAPELRPRPLACQHRRRTANRGAAPAATGCTGAPAASNRGAAHGCTGCHMLAALRWQPVQPCAAPRFDAAGAPVQPVAAGAAPRFAFDWTPTVAGAAHVGAPGCAVGVQSNANRGAARLPVAAPATATGCTGAPATATLEASIEGGTANRGAAHVAYKASSSPSERVLRKPCHGIPKPANRPRGCARRRTGCQWLASIEGERGARRRTGHGWSPIERKPRGCTGCHWLHRSSGCIEPRGCARLHRLPSKGCQHRRRMANRGAARLHRPRPLAASIEGLPRGYVKALNPVDSSWRDQVA